MELYFDNNATTPVAEAVIDAISRTLREEFGNPSSHHAFGDRAASLVAEARGEVARLVGAGSPREIVFTSCGTEANNAAVFAALAREQAGERRLLVTSAGEHASVLQPLQRAADDGFELLTAPLEASGAISLPFVLDVLAERGAEVALVSLQAANNETGACVGDGPLSQVIEAAHSAGAPVHVDAVQVPGKLPLDVSALGVDLLSVSAHKFHGPKGVGALFVDGTFAAQGLAPFLTGGAQERDRRGGTLNVPGIVGMGVAAALARRHLAEPEDTKGGVRALRDGMESALRTRFPAIEIHAEVLERLPNTSSIRFPGVDGELLLGLLAGEGLAASTGAACSSEKKEPSHVLLALGRSREEAEQSLRFSLSRLTTPAEVQRAVQIITEALEELSLLSPAPK